jgi:prolyl-tRNA synthetase
MHRWSELFIPTLREAPADAEVASHKFLVRAGYIRQLMAGVYSYLFLGTRSFNKITAIVRQEMDRIGQEFLLPALHPRELWEASGRAALMGENLFRLKDRKGADLVLGMTEEEVMTSIAVKELRSYKQLPQIWYQIAPKFRDEPRPKSGLLRVRQFMMKDAYSFDIDAAGLDVSYKKHYETYCRIFDRCGLKYMVVEADSGAMGGKESHEFMVRTPAGGRSDCELRRVQLRGEYRKSYLEAVAGGRPCRRRRWRAAGSAHSGAEDDRRCGALSGSFAEEQDQDAGFDGGRAGAR